MKKTKKSASPSIGSGIVEIDPSIVRFTHSRIRPYFSGCGRRIEDTLNDILTGQLTVLHLPMITVLEIYENGSPIYFSLNNRRLYVFKQLKQRNLLDTIRVRIKSPLDREREKYKSEKFSFEATIMNERRVGPDDDVSGDEIETNTDCSSPISSIDEIPDEPNSNPPILPPAIPTPSAKSKKSSKSISTSPSPSFSLLKTSLQKLMSKNRTKQARSDLEESFDDNLITESEYQELKQTFQL